MSTGRSSRTHNQRAPDLNDIAPGPKVPARSRSSAAVDEVARADAEARRIEAQSKADQAAMGTIGRFVGDVQRAALFGIVVLVLIAFVALTVAASVDHTYLGALVEVAKAVIFGAIGYLGARLGPQRR